MYVAQYRKYYPADKRKFVWDKLPMEEGYAMIAAAMQLDGWLQFSGVKIDGYIASEIKKQQAK